MHFVDRVLFVPSRAFYGVSFTFLADMGLLVCIGVGRVPTVGVAPTAWVRVRLGVS